MMEKLEQMREKFLGELPAFKEETVKFLNGEISKMEYKGKSGGFGVYAQRDQKTFMVRLRLSSGVASKEQLEKVCEIAQKYNVDKVHFTTRQAIQLHDLDVDSLLNIMEECIKNDIFTRGGGGNFPRNVGMSPLSGVDEEEAFDVTPYAIATDRYFMSQITTYHLPRKLKVSFSSSMADDAHATAQDLGFLAVKKDDKPYFKVFVGGGLGKNPALGLELDELISPNEVLYYVEGLVKLFMAEGDYNNKNKARVRYMVERLGKEEFIAKFKEFVNKEKENKELELTVDEVQYPNDNETTININDERVFSQKQKGYYSVYVHPVAGQIKTQDLKTLLKSLENCKDASLRLAMTEGIYIINLKGEEVEEVLTVSKPFSACTTLEKSVACIGVPACQMGIQNSQKMLNEIITYFRANSNDDSILNAMPRIHVSGCMNSCGVHQIGTIGLTGKKKRVDGEMHDAFEIFVDGKYGVGETRLGKSLGDFKASDIPMFLFEIGEKATKCNLDFYDYYTNYEEEFKAITNKYAL